MGSILKPSFLLYDSVLRNNVWSQRCFVYFVLFLLAIIILFCILVKVQMINFVNEINDVGSFERVNGSLRVFKYQGSVNNNPEISSYYAGRSSSQPWNLTNTSSN